MRSLIRMPGLLLGCSLLRYRAALTLGVLVAVPLVHPDLAAQACFRGRPLPSCRRFWIVESGFGVRLNRGAYESGPSDPDKLASMELGMMRNLTTGTALGATAFLGIGDQITGNTGVLVGVKPRYRRWLGPRFSLDLSTGPFYVLSGPANANTLGATAHAGVNLGDWAGLTGQILVGKSAHEANRSTRVWGSISAASWVHIPAL